MKKILILILTICSIAGYGQTQLNPSGSNSVANINTALTMPAVAAGTNTYTTTIIGATLTTNKAYTILFTNGNSASSTININDGTNPLGAITLKKYSSGSLVNLSSGDISSGETKRFRYNGTNFVMEGGSGSGGGGALTPGSGTTDNGTAVDLGGTQTSDAVISGDGGTYGMTFDEQGHFTVNVQGGGDASTTVADGGDAKITSNSGNITLTTYSGNATEIIASGTGIDFHVGGDGIKVDLNGDATGDMFSRKSTGFLERIAPNSTGTKKFLTQTSSATPAWGTIANTDVSGLGTLSTQNGTFSGTSSGTNTGDQTLTFSGAFTGSGTGAVTATLATPGTLTVSSTNSNATAHTHAITSSSAPGAAASLLSTDASGIIGSTGTRITKGWFTDLTVTNAIAGSVTGNAATVTTNANLSGDVISSGNTTTYNAVVPSTKGGAGSINGILKANGSGVTSVVINSDLPAMTATVGGAVPTPPNNTSTFLRGDGTFAAPSGSGTVNAGTANQLGYYATSSSAISGLTAITASRALTSDANGLPIAAPGGTTSTELGYVNGVTSAIQTQIDTKYDKAPTHNTQTGSYTLVLTDAGKVVEMNVAGANNLTVPLNSSVAYPTGTQITLVQYGAGTITVVATGGVTINSSSGSLLSVGQYSTMVLDKRGTNEWYLWNGSKNVPTLTDGSVAFYSSTAGNLSQDNSNFFWDIGNKRLGLGLTTPASHIEIRDNTLSTTPSINSGLTFSNTATASLGVQKQPGQIYFNGKAWNTGSSASQDVSIRMQMVPTQGSSVSANLLMGINPNAAGYTDVFLLNASGFANAGQSVRIGTTALETNSIKRISSAQTTFESFSGIASGSALKLQYSSTFQQTSGDVGGMENFQSTVIASGTATPYNTRLDGTLNNAGSGTHTMLRIDPTITAQGGDMVGIDYNPTITSITGIHYGIRIRPSARNGWGVASPTALMHIGAGTASANTAPLKFTSGTNLTTPEAGAVEFDGTNYFGTASTTRYTFAKTLTATATLDFGSTTAGNATDLTITVTGAADGDAVSIGVPNGSTLSDGAFTAWVSASNTVTIRFINNNLVTALDPASGTFRASVIKY